jgi:hypothetical protein
MSAKASGSVGESGDAPETASKPEKLSGSPAELERAIQQRRDHLAATIDELTARASPKDIARRTGAGIQQKLMTLTHSPDGQVRTERVGAVAGAVAVLAGLLFVLRRRR